MMKRKKWFHILLGGAKKMELSFSIQHRDERTLATKYEKLGGKVKWMGKPDKIIYKAAAEMAAIDPSQCVAIGDSLYHDIKGANATGISSAFITGGIHATELGLDTFGEIADDSSVVALALRHDAYPSYVLPSFNW
ncbi:uncharacterized protein [Coffea arabica]|uniref:Uncharacterized protein LOC113737069 n=2 Tax=Coffea arabica TaxID=13443 RepID=A0A6P6WXF0_COFAR|nr:uncharacterized protein LOC113737069 [Coffea arabica]